jgi:hypothetical protein
MSNEACTIALKNALDEIKSVCPEISNTFIFRENGESLLEDQSTTEGTTKNAQEAFCALAEKGDTLGGIESVTFKGSQGRINFNKFKDFYVANVSSNEADQKTVVNLTRVMIPTVLKLVQQGVPTAQEHIKEPAIKAKYEEMPIAESYQPEIQPNQFTIENVGFGGFLGDPDAALVDTAQIAQWIEMFGDKHISKITVNNLQTGKSVNCPFKPIKESKFEGKGIIQIPEKIQLTLHVQKGDRVSIKPILENPVTAPSVPVNEQQISIRNLFSRKTAASPKREFYLQDAPVSQFIVENLKGIGGFLSTPDFVRVDRAIVSQWKELFDGKEIKEVIIEETTTGKKVRCAFQTIKDSNLEGKGIVQIPEKAQQMLQTKKGALVVVKPVIE